MRAGRRALMFGFGRRRAGPDPVARLHEAIVAASRMPALYERGGVPDSVEGRFEALTLHVLLVLRRLRQLPPPAEDVAQELVDAVFANLEVALREMGVGDFGVPKRMKKLAQAFYDRTWNYDAALDARDPEALVGAIAARLETAPEPVRPFARYLLASESLLAARGLDELLAGLPFATDALAAAPEPAP